MKTKTILNNTYRGFLGILCLLLLGTIEVKAETNNDLKEYLNLESNTNISDEEQIIYKYDTGEDILDKYNREKAEEEEEKQKLEILKDRFNETNVEIGMMLRNSYSANSILEKIDELKAINEDISKTEMDELEENKVIEKVEGTVYKSSEDILSSYYNIGEIGSSLKPCVDNFIIEKPYGYKAKYNYKTDKYTKDGTKHTGITIKCSSGDNVYAQFNGIVYSVELDNNNDTFNVNLYHGDNTYTIYKGINKNTNIVKGDIINQYDLIGQADKNNIEFEVMVNNKYINPILIYGKTGMNIYLNYLENSDEKYLVGKDELYFIEK